MNEDLERYTDQQLRDALKDARNANTVAENQLMNVGTLSSDNGIRDALAETVRASSALVRRLEAEAARRGLE